ncbi:MAG: hypothetical protein IJ690_02025 [Clostridia bacterium]|nr:hypothetical protein [Clostridia bacterium]MBR1653719.1 hypothetical protein [Clostridia bacterium]
MNFNKDLFEKTEAKEFGEFESLSLGGHEVVILSAEEYTSPVSGNTSLRVCVDIAGNDEQAGYFKKQYDAQTGDKKWATGGVRYLSLKDDQLAYLKGTITAIENSNTGFKFNTAGTWEQLKGKKLAGVFGLEEYLDNEGKLKTATKLTQFRSLDKLSEIKIPKVKLLDGTMVDYDEYKNKSLNVANKIFDNEIVTTDEIPFEI